MISIKVLMVIPGDGSSKIFPFALRQAESVTNNTIITENFFLKSRINVLRLLEEFIRFRKKTQDFSPDIIHAHYGTMTAFFCAISTRVPLIITFQGSDLNPAPGMNPIRNWIGHLLSQFSSLFASKIICPSSQLVNRLWWKKKSVDVIPSGVNLNLFHPMSIEKARKILNWSTDEKIVLFNARNDPIGKRLDLAFEAVQIAEETHPNLRLVVLRGEVHPDKMPLYYNAANCLLVTSDYESQPLIVKEAIACNCPVVSVDVGDVAGLLENVYPSKIVSRSPEAIGDTITEFLEIGSRSNGSEWVSEITEEKIAARLVNLYIQIHKNENERGS